jgi:hypothetical protein
VRQRPTSTIQRVFFGELRRLGYVEGKNLIIGWYSAEGRIERYPEVVLEVIRWNPHVIVGPLKQPGARISRGHQIGTNCGIHN